MADVRLTRVRKSFGTVQVLHDIDLAITSGEFVVFVGPSGCGKSTLLRCIAGLEEVDAGEVAIAGRVVNELPPAERSIAMVFQSYALYPHLSLYDNIAFGLQLQKMPRAEIDRLVRQAAGTLHIEHLLERKPRDLSGGQRQRVAIGRAIVRKPQVFLFDEPLSNLDAELRVRMRYEFAKLHQDLRATMIYVTHDQVEAMTLADRIVVLNAGRVVQAGAPLELYEHPVDRFVAGFIGSPKMNFVRARVEQLDANGATVSLADGARVRCLVDASAARVGDEVTYGIRPEHVLVGGGDNPITLPLNFVERLGGATYAYGDLVGMDAPMTCQLAGDERLRGGDKLVVSLPTPRGHLFDAKGQAFRRLGVVPRERAA